MNDPSIEVRDCSKCRYADFDAGEPGLCWRGAGCSVMPPQRCEHYHMDDCFKENQRCVTSN